jgi:hypothetical protein
MIRPRFSYANLTSTLALLLAFGGTSYAADTLTGSAREQGATVGCPGAMVDAINLCVEKKLSGPDSWESAVTTCLIRRRRLPTPAEAFGTYRFHGIDAGATWTSTAYRLPEPSNGQNEQGTWVFTVLNERNARVRIGAAGLATPKTFGCVTEPGGD